MPDYGHPLRFGTFITPLNDNPQRVVSLAMLSEELGYDLVTFQDHPYQTQFLDTWTLISWVAAVTEKIHLSGNVMNLPLRNPAILAKSAASLDLLSGGRVEMGLGAGVYWDPMYTLGVEKLTPGQSVQALEEAVDILKGMWETDTRGIFKVEGDFHKIRGARRGPRPAHKIPIVLGALKPRMQRLIGRKADGWVPSLQFMLERDYRAGNAIIDEAALKAGRRPEDIRRYLNVPGTFSIENEGLLKGPASQWVDELFRFAVEDGVSTFILIGDDEYFLTKFAEEVATPLKEQVAKHRKETGTTSHFERSESVKKFRVAGIDYESIPPSLKANAIEPGDFDYAITRSTYARGGNPGLILRPSNTIEVKDALAYTKSQNRELSIRSGGHGLSGRSTNNAGIVISLEKINHVEVTDPNVGTVRIGPGATWKKVAKTLSNYGLAITSGDYGGVGVGGLSTAGGIGFLARNRGLTIDHLRSVEIVTADGRIIHASDQKNSELFWGIRGAGANFGIITDFIFEADKVTSVGYAELTFQVNSLSEFIHSWGALVESSPREVTSSIHINRKIAAPQTVLCLIIVDTDNPEVSRRLIKPFLNLAQIIEKTVIQTTYAQVMSNSTDFAHNGRGEPNSRSALVKHLDAETATAVAELIQSGSSFFTQIRAVGGAVSDIQSDATSYAHRDANFAIASFSFNRAKLDKAWISVKRRSIGSYLNFDTSTDISRLETAFPAKTLYRLKHLKTIWDPENVFRDNFNIAPETGV